MRKKTEVQNIVMIDDDVWNHVEMRAIPELPKVSFCRRGVTFSVTDLRYLDKAAVELLKICIERAIQYPETEYIKFDVSKVEKQQIEITKDILHGLSYSATPHNGIGIDSDNILVGGFITIGDKDKETLEVVFIREHAMALSKRYKGKDVETITIFDIVETLYLDTQDRFEKYSKIFDEEEG